MTDGRLAMLFVEWNDGKVRQHTFTAYSEDAVNYLKDVGYMIHSRGECRTFSIAEKSGEQITTLEIIDPDKDTLFAEISDD